MTGLPREYKGGLQLLPVQRRRAHCGPQAADDPHVQ